MPLSPKDLIGSAEVCEQIGIDRSTLSRWVTAGKLAPTVRLPGPNGAMLFTRKDVDRLAAEVSAA